MGGQKIDKRTVLATAAISGSSLLAGCSGILGSSGTAPDEEATPSSTAAPADQETPAGPPTGVLFETDFETDGVDAEQWVYEQGDDEIVEIREGVLYNDSPKNENRGAWIQTADPIATTGTVRIESRMRLYDPDSWDGNVGGMYFHNSGGGVMLVELDNFRYTEFSLKLNDGSGTTPNQIGPHVGDTEWHDYAFTVDFDAERVTKVTRDDETFQPNLDISSAIGDSDWFRAGISLSRGVEKSHDSYTVRRLE